MAVLRFSGTWTDTRFVAAVARLLAWIDAQGLSVAGLPEFAYYDDPFTLPFLRRNEVLVPVIVIAPGGLSNE